MKKIFKKSVYLVSLLFVCALFGSANAGPGVSTLPLLGQSGVLPLPHTAIPTTSVPALPTTIQVVPPMPDVHLRDAGRSEHPRQTGKEHSTKKDAREHAERKCKEDYRPEHRDKPPEHHPHGHPKDSRPHYQTNKDYLKPGKGVHHTYYPRTHIVVKDDNLWSISLKYGIPFTKIISMNKHFPNPHSIKPGQVVNLG